MAGQGVDQDRIDTAPPPGAGTGHGRWTRLATLGLLMMAAGPAVLLIGGNLLGGATSEDLPFFGGTMIVALIGAFLVWRFGLWSKVVGIILALLTGMALFWTAFGLFSPNSFFDFVPGLLVPPGLIIAIVGCIAAIVAARRGRASEEASGERKTMRIVLAIVGTLALVSAVLTFTSRSTVEEGAEVATTVAAADFEYPDTLELNAGDTILVRNDDAFLHTFTVDELDIDVQIGPKSEELIEIPEGSGSYVFYCEPHTSSPDEPGEGDMAGELTIQ